MRIPFLFLIVTLLLTLGVDGYIYAIARRRCRSHVPARIQLFSALALYVLVIVGIFLPARGGDPAMLLTKMWVLFGYMTFFVAKVAFVLFDLIGGIPCLFGRKRLPKSGLVAGLIGVAVFLAMWWGALINRFNVQLNEVDVEIAGLPEVFDGYTIAQISDLHVGTYGSDTDFVERLVDYVNSLDADVICFTGDIVNRTTDEIIPFVGPLSKLHAPDGVFSILGNHDYGDYYDWDSEAEKQASLQRLKDIQTDMGWTLLLNEHRFVSHGRDSIAILGVENVGDPPFTVYGDLKASYPNLGDSVSKVLLSHNPAHWDMEVADHKDVNIGLTLSGHTHAMQMTFFGWSPAVFRYLHWGGLYGDKSGDHQLYVNIGDGTVGMPMRLGATPEVTLITLRRK